MSAGRPCDWPSLGRPSLAAVRTAGEREKKTARWRDRDGRRAPAPPPMEVARHRPQPKILFPCRRAGGRARDRDRNLLRRSDPRRGSTFLFFLGFLFFFSLSLPFFFPFFFFLLFGFSGPVVGFGMCAVEGRRPVGRAQSNLRSVSSCLDSAQSTSANPQLLRVCPGARHAHGRRDAAARRQHRYRSRDTSARLAGYLRTCSRIRPHVLCVATCKRLMPAHRNSYLRADTLQTYGPTCPSHQSRQPPSF